MLVWVAAFAVLILDFVTKFVATRELAFYPAVPITLGNFTFPSAFDAQAMFETAVRRVQVIPGFFDFYLQHNTGGAFSVMNSYPLVLAAISVGAIAWLVHWSRSLPRERWVPRAAFGLIIGGAVGNLVDRLRFGYVVDFLHFYRGEWYWPTFNIADCGIVVGITVVVSLSLFTKQLEPAVAEAQPAPDAPPGNGNGDSPATG